MTATSMSASERQHLHEPVGLRRFREDRGHAARVDRGSELLEVGRRGRRERRSARDRGTDDLEVEAIGQIAEHMVVGDERAVLVRDSRERVGHLGVRLGEIL